VDIYGNCIAAARFFLKDNPEAVKGFIRATIKGVHDMVADPGIAVQTTVKIRTVAQCRYRTRSAITGD
jgi:NitT/TauT family transport system substrate-binding protein